MGVNEQRSRLLCSWALEAGFDLAGVALLEPSERGHALVSWLDRGEHAGMSWMERRLEARLDPRQILPGARSALCVALRYWPLEGASHPENDLWEKVARYARGEDYHRIFQRRLRELGERIAASFPGTSWRAYSDTGPLLERELAALAGLGAVGKNTLLLHPRFGSWMLLGEIILDLELAAGSPLPDLCGSCTACLEACPTGALTEPYRLDANRCLSYWTIEARQVPPEARRDKEAAWVFGCDICQEVCPWNASPPPVDQPELGLPEPRRGLDLAGLLASSRDAYVETFRHSALKRAGLPALRRNAAVVLGHRLAAGQAATGAQRALSGALCDDDPSLRAEAAQALGGAPRGEALDSLRTAARKEAEPAVRSALAAALRRQRRAAVVDTRRERNIE